MTDFVEVVAKRGGEDHHGTGIVLANDETLIFETMDGQRHRFDHSQWVVEITHGEGCECVDLTSGHRTSCPVFMEYLRRHDLPDEAIDTVIHAVPNTLWKVYEDAQVIEEWPGDEEYEGTSLKGTKAQRAFASRAVVLPEHDRPNVEYTEWRIMARGVSPRGHTTEWWCHTRSTTEEDLIRAISETMHEVSHLEHKIQRRTTTPWEDVDDG